MSATPATNRGVRLDIQALRAVAVTSVVLYHAHYHGFDGGYVGVDVFFVISGYLITTHLYGPLRRGERYSLVSFYAQRARRLLPMAALVASVATLGSWLWLDQVQARSESTDALWTSIFALNFRLADQGVQYSNNAAPSAVQHYWSLAVEEQFYLLWPLLLLALTWGLWRRRGGARRAPAGLPWLAVVVLASITGLSYLWCIHETSYARSLAYFLTPARAWELGVGALLALVAPAIRRIPAALAVSLALGGMGAIVSAVVLLSDASAFPGWIAIWPVAGAAAVLLGGLPGRSPLDRVFGLRPVQWLGDISYALYLWHFPVLMLAPTALGHSLGTVDTIGALLLAVWLAGASHFVLEDPVRFLPSLRRPSRTAGLAVGFTACLAASVMLGPQVAPAHPGPGPAAKRLTVLPRANLTTEIEQGNTRRLLPSNLMPQLPQLLTDTPTIPWADARSCMVDLQATAALNSCRTTPFGTTKVVVAGDSHAFQWMPALMKIASQRNWTLYDITKSGCPLYDATVFSTDFDRTYTECNTWRKSAVHRIDRIKPAILLTSAFVASSRGRRYAQGWITGVTETVSHFRALGTTVVALGDTPWPNHDPTACLTLNKAHVSTCAVPTIQPWRDSVRQRGTSAAAARAGAVVIDPTSWFCAAGKCPPVIGNVAVYHDQTHMSATYCAALTPVLAKALRKVR